MSFATILEIIHVRLTTSKKIMNKAPLPDQRRQHLQDAWDWLSVSANAATSAEFRFRQLYEHIARRGIDKVRSIELVEPGPIPHRDVYFCPTDEERKALMDAYSEWQALKVIWAEKTEAYKFVEEHGIPFTDIKRAEQSTQKAKEALITIGAKMFFFALTTIAALVVIARVF